MPTHIESICLNFSIHFVVVSFSFVILAFISVAYGHGGATTSCGNYGAPPCQFVPAPPGQTPACARPGQTYCEHIENYPAYLIKHLVHKWGYEAKNLIVDESWEDFSAVAWHNTPVFYDPSFIFPPRPEVDVGYTYGSPTMRSNSGTGYGSEKTFFITKQQPQQQHHQTQQQQPHAATETPTFLLYSSAAQRLNLHNNKNDIKVTANNPTLWLKRIVRDLSSRKQMDGNLHLSPIGVSNHTKLHETAHLSSSMNHTRDVSIHMDLMDIVGVHKPTAAETTTTHGDGSSSRMRRQSTGRNSLCQTLSQFVTPQAALNSKGNWMFVVNEANTARQMVKAELCASNTCSNLCQLPNGYNSRCEQKFVQKRLIALKSNGQNLYTDTFWFPSCCVCTISTN